MGSAAYLRSRLSTFQEGLRGIRRVFAQGKKDFNFILDVFLLQFKSDGC